MFSSLFLLLTSAATGFGAIGGAPSETALAQLPNVSFPAPNQVASGRLQASDIALLKAAGIGQVIDLSVDSETPHFDEAAAVRAVGIEYHNLPIHGSQDLTRSNVILFDQLLSKAGNTPTLVHCASSNRVGAMIALRAALIQGEPIEAALTEGRRWGMKSLEPVVREQLGALQKSP